MIDSIEIQRFRGIREGSVGALAPLTILVGPNGCGKSAVLQALAIAVDPQPPGMLGAVVARWGHHLSGAARWISYRAGAEGDCVFDARASVAPEARARVTRLHVEAAANDVVNIEMVSGPSADSLFYAAAAHFNPNNTLGRTSVDEVGSTLVPAIKFSILGEGISPVSIVDLYSAVVERGAKDAAEDVLRAVVPGALSLEILTRAGQSYLSIRFKDRALPVAVAGDGVRSIIRYALELASLADGLVLLDEPEAFMHPAAIHQLVRVLWATVQRGVQIVIATHSLELIDSVVAEAPEDIAQKLAVFRLALKDNALNSTRMDGDTVARRRTEIDEDLR